MKMPVRPPSRNEGLRAFKVAVKSLPRYSFSNWAMSWPVAPGAIWKRDLVVRALLHLQLSEAERAPWSSILPCANTCHPLERRKEGPRRVSKYKATYLARTVESGKCVRTQSLA